jgi:hypothetical protein
MNIIEMGVAHLFFCALSFVPALFSLVYTIVTVKIRSNTTDQNRTLIRRPILYSVELSPIKFQNKVCVGKRNNVNADDIILGARDIIAAMYDHHMIKDITITEKRNRLRFIGRNRRIQSCLNCSPNLIQSTLSGDLAGFFFVEACAAGI